MTKQPHPAISFSAKTAKLIRHCPGYAAALDALVDAWEIGDTEAASAAWDKAVKAARGYYELNGGTA
mgnify:CR=1 FL=1